MHVKVEQKHIDEGICGSAQRCAVAKALLDIDGVVHSSVGVITCTVMYENGGRKDFKIPPEAQDFIERFDNRALVEPIEFDLIPV